MTTRKARNDAIAAVHETARGLLRAGVVSKETMRQFDQLCLSPVCELRPDEIRALREKERASQAVFAAYLNVTTGLISQWERGEKRPSGPALKLLTLIRKNGLQSVA